MFVTIAVPNTKGVDFAIDLSIYYTKVLQNGTLNANTKKIFISTSFDSPFPFTMNIQVISNYINFFAT
jgi:hypothetical protein